MYRKIFYALCKVCHESADKMQLEHIHVVESSFFFSNVPNFSLRLSLLIKDEKVLNDVSYSGTLWFKEREEKLLSICL